MAAHAPSPLERRLSAYVDGQVPQTERQDVEAALVNDPVARSLHDDLKRGTETGRRLFDDMLKEPVPLDLVRGIKNAPLPRRAIRLPAPPAGGLAFNPSRRSLAGCLLMLVLGSSIGYMVGAQSASVTAPVSSTHAEKLETRDWLDDIVSHYRLYARQQNRLTEVGADHPADILEWLTTGTGVSFRIPDLGDSGLSFIGARLISADNTPTGILFYRRNAGDNDGDILALTVSRTRPETTKPIEDIRIDTGLVSWSSPLATYVLVGPSSAADLDDIAAKAAGLI